MEFAPSELTDLNTENLLYTCKLYKQNEKCPGVFLTIVAVWLCILSSRRPWLGDPVTVVLLLTVCRCLWLVGEGHNGGGGVGGGGGVLGVGEAVQVLAGSIDGAVDGTFSGAADAVFLCLV